MEYAHVSVKFPSELNEEIERFLEETRVYTNKSEFIKEACRSHLQTLQNDAAIAALRVEQMMAQAAQHSAGDEDLLERLDELQAAIDADPDKVEAIVSASREETSERTFEGS